MNLLLYKCIQTRTIQLNHIQQIKTRFYSQLFKPKVASSLVLQYNYKYQCIPYRNNSEYAFANTAHAIFQTLSESRAVEISQKFLVNFHEFSGLPWWATIVISTIVLRSCITLPLAIYQNYILAKVENLTLEMPAIVDELKKETAIAMKHYKWTEKQARITYNRSLKKQWQRLIVRENCHPLKATILLWAQIPLWVCISVSIRNLVYMLPKMDFDAQIIFAELNLGGFGWISNLTLPDSTLILPLSLGLLNLAIIELQTMARVKQSSKIQRYLTNFFRFISIGLIPISAYVPSSLCLYWVTSSGFGLVQNLVLLNPQVKRIVRIPQTPSELQKPYHHIWDKLKNRII